MILPEIVEQLELCNYTCEGGDLKDNVAFIELKRLACDTAMADVEQLRAEQVNAREDVKRLSSDLQFFRFALEQERRPLCEGGYGYRAKVERLEAENVSYRAHATGIGEKVKKVCMKAAMKWRQDRNNGRTGQGVDIYIDAAVDVAALLAGGEAGDGPKPGTAGWLVSQMDNWTPPTPHPEGQCDRAIIVKLEGVYVCSQCGEPASSVAPGGQSE